MKLIVSRAALDDLARLREFLAGRNPVAAQRAVSIIAEAIDSLALHAERGRPSALEGIRELIVPFGRSAYVICYLLDSSRQEIVIMRLWHGREARP